jgi:hypothetical protein
MNPRLMNVPLRLALAIAVVAGGPLVVGCNDSSPGKDGGIAGCTVSCPIPYGFATFNLSCGATDLMSVAVSGSCVTVADLPSNLVFEQSIAIYSPTPGVCHVELTFATGFTYSTDVTFEVNTAKQQGCCALFDAPTQTTFMVNNPSTTCVDPGASDAGADAPIDGPGEDASCPQGVPCGCSCPNGDDGGVCVCQNFSMPACPSNAVPSTSCNYNGDCMGCGEGAGFTCGCSDAGALDTDGGGAHWLCVGTEYACTGGTP